MNKQQQQQEREAREWQQQEGIISGTSIVYRKPRDVWAEQGYAVVNNNVVRINPQPALKK